MATRRFKQHLWGRLMWQLCVPANTGGSQSLRAGHVHAGSFKTHHLSRALPALSVVKDRSRLNVHRSLRATDADFQTAQTRSASFVSETEYRHSPVTSDNILRNPLPDIFIPSDLSIHQMVFDNCDKYKDNLAVVRIFHL